MTSNRIKSQRTSRPRQIKVVIVAQNVPDQKTKKVNATAPLGQQISLKAPLSVPHGPLTRIDFQRLIAMKIRELQAMEAADKEIIALKASNKSKEKERKEKKKSKKSAVLIVVNTSTDSHQTALRKQDALETAEARIQDQFKIALETDSTRHAIECRSEPLKRTQFGQDIFIIPIDASLGGSSEVLQSTRSDADSEFRIPHCNCERDLFSVGSSCAEIEDAAERVQFTPLQLIKYKCIDLDSLRGPHREYSWFEIGNSRDSSFVASDWEF